MNTQINPYESLQFPIGRYQKLDAMSPGLLRTDIDDIEALPTRLEALVLGANAQDLLRPYRPDGWNAAQVVHHMADSHMNGYIRTKLALTEDNPVIKPYIEHLWALHSDAVGTDLTHSLNILRGVHARWAACLRGLRGTDYSRTFHHPEMGRDVPIFDQAHLSAWHSRHHLEHVRLGIQGKVEGLS
jgi:hypothetical protein